MLAFQGFGNFQFGLREGGIKPFEMEWEADQENWIDVVQVNKEEEK